MGQPMTQSGPCSVAVVSVIAELSPQSSELVLIWKRFRCLTKNLSRCFVCPLSSGSFRGIWSTANRLFGVSMSTCKTRSQAHGLQTRPYTFLSLAGKHQYSVRTNNRVYQKYPLTVDTSVCIVTVVSGDASTEALFDG